jgi:hypothetical protein
MSQARPKWKQVERYFLRHGYSIYDSGGDKIIVAPANLDPTRRRQTLRIGHRFTDPGAQLPWGHINQIKRAFGVTTEDLRSG